MTANLLTAMEPNLSDFSECSLIDHANQVDFDSAIPRFESWRPSQPPGSVRRNFRLSEKWRHFRGLAGNGRVFGEENRAFPTEGGVFLEESLLHEFSISGI
jgi:hypothetical protein